MFTSHQTLQREEDENKNILEDMEWPKFIRAPLNVAQNSLIQALACTVMSVFLFFGFQTAICGACLLLAALMFFIGFCRGEKVKPITGIQS